MKSIRFRVIGTYLLIIAITITLFAAGAYSLIKNYYVSNIESILSAGLDVCNDIYNDLYYQYDIELEAEKIGERFEPYTEAQILILDTSGYVLYDSIQLYDAGFKGLEKDLQEILDGQTITHMENSELGERIISVSRTITSDQQIIGILKLSSSMEGTYKALRQVLLLLAAGGSVIIIIVSIIALVLSNTIVRPVNKITGHVKSIAAGDLEPKPGSRYMDEFSGLTDNLNDLSAELKRNKMLRTKFISTISHELRTPLTSIKGWVITLKNSQKEDTDLFEEGMDIIDTEADRLTSLVNNLLDFTDYSSSKEIPESRDFNIAELIEYTCRQMEPRAMRLGITMECNVDKKPMPVRGNYDRLKQVLINIIDNSLKYSDTGDKVIINASERGDRAFIAIEDTGPGISENDLENVFEIYYQGSNAKEGNGLGLALSKEIIDSHSGTISIGSMVGKGTSVCIELPVSRGGDQ